MWTIVSKELRELIRLLPVGLVLLGVAVWLSLPRGIQGSPNPALIACSAGLFAVLLAAMQGFFDFSDRQRGFLFHRSLSRATIMYGKLLAALIVYSIAVALPLGCMAVYFARMGPEYMPVHPAQVLPILAVCLAGFAMHPATLFTIDREAHWLGTRLLPLPLAIAGVFFMAVAIAVGTTSAIAIMSTLLVGLFIVLLLALQPEHFARKLVLAGGAVTVVLSAIVFGATLLDSLTVRYSATHAEYGIDEDGELWVFQSRYEPSENGYNTLRVPVSGGRVESERKVNLNGTLPADFDPSSGSNLAPLGANRQTIWYQYGGAIGRKQVFSVPPGIALIYEHGSTPPLQGVVSRSGFHPSANAVGDPFTGPAFTDGMWASSALSAAGYDTLWVDRKGVYQFDRERGTITALVELPVESATVLVTEDFAMEEPAQDAKVVRLYVETSTQAHLFKLTDAAGEANWFVSNSENRSRPLPELQAVEERTLPRLPKSLRIAMLGMSAEGSLVAFAGYPNVQRAVVANAPGAEWKLEQLMPPDIEVQGSRASAYMVAITPPAALFVVVASLFIYSAVNDLPSPATFGSPDGAMPVVLLVGAAAMVGWIVLVWVLGRRRGFSTSKRVAWSLATLLAGPVGPLLLIALYPPVHREPCPRCDRLRQVDRGVCPHCASAWEAVQSEGIEIIDFETRGNWALRRQTEASSGARSSS